MRHKGPSKRAYEGDDGYLREAKEEGIGVYTNEREGVGRVTSIY